MSVRQRGSFIVDCDKAGCRAYFEADDMTKSAAEARFFAIECGWQSVPTADGRRREFCPRHRLRAPVSRPLVSR